MIYQIFYDENSASRVETQHEFVTPCGVYKALELPRLKGCVYDDEKAPNLTQHNTLCEWRVLYYIWQHYPSAWIGFTSWRHDEKQFNPTLESTNRDWLMSQLINRPIAGFMERPLRSLMLKGAAQSSGVTLKTQFVQWKIVESLSGVQLNDSRSIPLAKYHDQAYWDFVMQEFQRIYSLDIERELDWETLATVDHLHTWCNAFVARWDYFDGYMKMFTPIVFGLMERFGSHSTQLELAYICERLIVLYNYIRYADDKSIFNQYAA